MKAKSIARIKLFICMPALNKKKWLIVVEINAKHNGSAGLGQGHVFFFFLDCASLYNISQNVGLSRMLNAP